MLPSYNEAHSSHPLPLAKPQPRSPPARLRSPPPVTPKTKSLTPHSGKEPATHSLRQVESLPLPRCSALPLPHDESHQLSPSFPVSPSSPFPVASSPLSTSPLRRPPRSPKPRNGGSKLPEVRARSSNVSGVLAGSDGRGVAIGRRDSSTHGSNELNYCLNGTGSGRAGGGTKVVEQKSPRAEHMKQRALALVESALQPLDADLDLDRHLHDIVDRGDGPHEPIGERMWRKSQALLESASQPLSLDFDIDNELDIQQRLDHKSSLPSMMTNSVVLAASERRQMERAGISPVRSRHARHLSLTDGKDSGRIEGYIADYPVSAKNDGQASLLPSEEQMAIPRTSPPAAWPYSFSQGLTNPDVPSTSQQPALQQGSFQRLLVSETFPSEDLSHSSADKSSASHYEVGSPHAGDQRLVSGPFQTPQGEGRSQPHHLQGNTKRPYRLSSTPSPCRQMQPGSHMTPTSQQGQSRSKRDCEHLQRPAHHSRHQSVDDLQALSLASLESPRGLPVGTGLTEIQEVRGKPPGARAQHGRHQSMDLNRPPPPGFLVAAGSNVSPGQPNRVGLSGTGAGTQSMHSPWGSMSSIPSPHGMGSAMGSVKRTGPKSFPGLSQNALGGLKIVSHIAGSRTEQAGQRQLRSHNPSPCGSPSYEARNVPPSQKDGSRQQPGRQLRHARWQSMDNIPTDPESSFRGEDSVRNLFDHVTGGSTEGGKHWNRYNEIELVSQPSSPEPRQVNSLTQEDTREAAFQGSIHRLCRSGEGEMSLLLESGSSHHWQKSPRIAGGGAERPVLDEDLSTGEKMRKRALLLLESAQTPLDLAFSIEIDGGDDYGEDDETGPLGVPASELSDGHYSSVPEGISKLPPPQSRSTDRTHPAQAKRAPGAGYKKPMNPVKAEVPQPPSVLPLNEEKNQLDRQVVSAERLLRPKVSAPLERGTRESYSEMRKQESRMVNRFDKAGTTQVQVQPGRVFRPQVSAPLERRKVGGAGSRKPAPHDEERRGTLKQVAGRSNLNAGPASSKSWQQTCARVRAGSSASLAPSLDSPSGLPSCPSIPLASLSQPPSPHSVLKLPHSLPPRSAGSSPLRRVRGVTGTGMKDGRSLSPMERANQMLARVYSTEVADSTDKISPSFLTDNTRANTAHPEVAQASSILMEMLSGFDKDTESPPWQSGKRRMPLTTAGGASMWRAESSPAQSTILQQESFKVWGAGESNAALHRALASSSHQARAGGVPRVESSPEVLRQGTFRSWSGAEEPVATEETEDRTLSDGLKSKIQYHGTLSAESDRVAQRYPEEFLVTKKGNRASPIFTFGGGAEGTEGNDMETSEVTLVPVFSFKRRNVALALSSPSPRMFQPATGPQSHSMWGVTESVSGSTKLVPAVNDRDWACARPNGSGADTPTGGPAPGDASGAQDATKSQKCQGTMAGHLLDTTDVQEETQDRTNCDTQYWPAVTLQTTLLPKSENGVTRNRAGYLEREDSNCPEQGRCPRRAPTAFINCLEADTALIKAEEGGLEGDDMKRQVVEGRDVGVEEEEAQGKEGNKDAVVDAWKVTPAQGEGAKKEEQDEVSIAAEIHSSPEGLHARKVNFAKDMVVEGGDLPVNEDSTASARELTISASEHQKGLRQPEPLPAQEKPDPGIDFDFPQRSEVPKSLPAAFGNVGGMQKQGELGVGGSGGVFSSERLTLPTINEAGSFTSTQPSKVAEAAIKPRKKQDPVDGRGEGARKPQQFDFPQQSKVPKSLPAAALEKLFSKKKARRATTFKGNDNSTKDETRSRDFAWQRKREGVLGTKLGSKHWSRVLSGIHKKIMGFIGMPIEEKKAQEKSTEEKREEKNESSDDEGALDEPSIEEVAEADALEKLEDVKWGDMRSSFLGTRMGTAKKP